MVGAVAILLRAQYRITCDKEVQSALCSYYLFQTQVRNNITEQHHLLAFHIYSQMTCYVQ